MVSMAPDDATNGYWLAAADGGIFTYGGASYLGRIESQARPPDSGRPQAAPPPPPHGGGRFFSSGRAAYDGASALRSTTRGRPLQPTALSRWAGHLRPG